MKKLTRKLFLSIAALACCAATLVSTTFAWYVNNPSADINTVNGSTASAGADGSLSVSTTGAKNTWFKTTNAATTATALEPATTADCLTFTNAENGAGKYQDYTFWIKAAGDAQTTATQDVNIKLVTTNESVLAGQIAYSTVGLGEGVTQGNLFAVDAVYALRMGISIQEGTTGDDGNATTEAALAFQGTTKMIDVATASLEYESAVTTAAGVTDISNKVVDSNEYYKALNGNYHSTGKDEVEGAAALPTLTLDTNVPYKVTIRVWLEGTDKYCFNSCGSQNFAFKFDFSLEQ